MSIVKTDYLSDFKDYTCKNIIYMIRNKINNKCYIGKSERTFKERYSRSMKNHHNIHLKKSIAKYGIENFEVIILEKEINDYNELCKLEVQYISLYKSYNPKYGYNKTYGGDGVRHTEETRQKTSRALKGRVFTATHKMLISKSRQGKNNLANLTEEQLQERSRKLSESLSGVGNGMYGKKHKTETILQYKKDRAGVKNAMYGKNIKDYMTEEAYEAWKKNIANHGAQNGRAKSTVVIYKNIKYQFGCAEEAISYFKDEMNEQVSRNWLYRGVNPKLKDKFQFLGYETKYLEYMKTQS